MNGLAFACLTCLDFGVLPEVGPCPTCWPAAYVEFVCALAEQAPLWNLGQYSGGEAA
jgi:hypothetical protein